MHLKNRKPCAKCAFAAVCLPSGRGALLALLEIRYAGFFQTTYKLGYSNAYNKIPEECRERIERVDDEAFAAELP